MSSSSPYSRRITALYALFLLPGTLAATWITRTPDIRDRLNASTDEMGLVLFGLAAGAMVGVLSAGAWVRRFGTRGVLGVNIALMAAGMAVVSLGVSSGQALIATGGLALFGAGMGLAEVAINIEGAAVERLSGRALMQTLHGCFSLGTVLGALVGIAFTAWRVPTEYHLMGLTLATLPGFWWAIRGLPRETGRFTPASEETPTTSEDAPKAANASVWRNPRVLMLGTIVLAVALSEGSANDWLPLLLVDVHGVTPALGSLGFMLFALTMTLGRFSGNALMRWLPRHTLFRLCIGLALLGVALITLTEHSGVAIAAVVLWGIGTSVGFPLSMSAAGEGDNGDAQVAATAIMGYIAFLAGPPLLGFIGEHAGLDRALMVVFVVLALGLAVSGAVRRQDGTVAPSHKG
ncbi:MFS transporter [Larsenimonas suaedae]|uniref:MFS transporter n=1 Tax=Larsenimonas suaedae TaxID=1851019 RepID=A0ABU1GRH9_9GAMM|nr:MFS transporter [Larsenimonas suaedae]MCM2972575.1 MFS transporter [Larsenimonas suaedae]MDR5894629.1 MFS transporter [Larsenimonas suaedae]